MKFSQRERKGELTVRLNMNERRAVIRVQAGRYRRAGKKEKGRILDEVVKLTGYHRRYAVRLLGLQGKAVRVDRHQRLVGELKVRARRRRGRVYAETVVEKLRAIWVILDGICGKRLVGILPEVVRVLERHGEIELDAMRGDECGRAFLGRVGLRPPVAKGVGAVGNLTQMAARR